jgi:transposase
MQVAQDVVGVDVAKAELCAFTLPRGERQTLANRTVAIRSWLARLAPGACIAVESTGSYHQLLVRLAQQAGRVVYVLNAKDVYFYAKALGVRGKTDGSDAQVIARYVAEHRERLHPYRAGSAQQQRLVELLRRRSQLQRHLEALSECLRGVAPLRAQRQALQRQAARWLAQLDAKIQEVVHEQAEMAEGYRRLLTITGIGPQSAALLTAVLGRLPFGNVDAVVAYSGLDPRPADSGTHRGRRRLTKRGPALLRKLLWLAAFSAGHSKLFGPMHEALRQRGLTATEATVVLARKLLRIAWGIWRSGQDFDPVKALARA